MSPISHPFFFTFHSIFTLLFYTLGSTILPIFFIFHYFIYIFNFGNQIICKQMTRQREYILHTIFLRKFYPTSLKNNTSGAVEHTNFTIFWWIYILYHDTKWISRAYIGCIPLDFSWPQIKHWRSPFVTVNTHMHTLPRSSLHCYVRIIGRPNPKTKDKHVYLHDWSVAVILYGSHW